MSLDPGSNADDAPETGGSGTARPTLGEKLDRFYIDRKQSGEMQTTEIPISLLLALDGIATGAYSGEPGARAQQQNAHQGELTAHLRRVSAYARLLATKCGLNDEEAKLVAQVSPMHDIGKWMIPAHILQKPAALDAAEWDIMKTHTLAGYEILKDSKLEVLKLAAMVAMQHQEKYDGSGYPLGLKGEEIHLYSRITTVADVFDALGSARAYKRSWTVEEIVDYFQRNRGSHFDPRLVDILLGDLDAFVAVRAGFDLTL
jgi:response regulator RpfG family c-di-GMP phosphodiesterase